MSDDQPPSRPSQQHVSWFGRLMRKFGAHPRDRADLIQLLREARREGMDKFVEDLRSKAKIELFEENLAKVEIRVEEQGHHHHGSPFSADIPDPKKSAAAADNAAEDEGSD